MAKRYTATEKWDKAWFRKLSPRHKALWQYLCDRCDQAGMWEVDFDSASHFVNDVKPITEADLKVFGARLERYSTDKIWIVDFISFQYTELSDKSPAHKPIFKLLSKYNLLHRVLSRLSNSLLEKEKETEEEKEMETKGGAGGKISGNGFQYDYVRGSDESMADVEMWTDSVLTGNDVHFMNMIRGQNINLDGQLERLARDHLGLCCRYKWHQDIDTQQAFRHSLIKHITEQLAKGKTNGKQPIKKLNINDLKQ